MTSTEPCLYSKFIYHLNQTFKKKDFLSPPKLLLSILHGEVIDVLTKSHRVLPQKLINQGFSLQIQDIKAVLTNLYENFPWSLRFETSQWIPIDKILFLIFFFHLKI